MCYTLARLRQPMKLDIRDSLSLKVFIYYVY